LAAAVRRPHLASQNVLSYDIKCAFQDTAGAIDDVSPKQRKSSLKLWEPQVRHTVCLQRPHKPHHATKKRSAKAQASNV
jgi:hypothetical protein